VTWYGGVRHLKARGREEMEGVGVDEVEKDRKGRGKSCIELVRQRSRRRLKSKLQNQS